MSDWKKDDQWSVSSEDKQQHFRLCNSDHMEEDVGYLLELLNERDSFEARIKTLTEALKNASRWLTEDNLDQCYCPKTAKRAIDVALKSVSEGEA